MDLFGERSSMNNCKFCGKLTKNRVFCNDICKGKQYKKELIRVPFKPNPSPELSYLLGVLYGDGSISVNSVNSGNYMFTLTAKDKEFVEEFQRCINAIIGKIYAIQKHYYKKTYGPYYTCCAYSKELISFLSNKLEYFKPIINSYPNDFLRGFFDSEGCFSSQIYKKSKNGNDCFTSSLSVCNTNKEIMLFMNDLLDRLDIKMTFYESAWYKRILGTTRNGKKYNKMLYRLMAYNVKTFIKFRDKIGFTIERKQNRLTETINRILKGREKTCKCCKKEFIAEASRRDYCDDCLRNPPPQMPYPANARWRWKNEIKKVNK